MKLIFPLLFLWLFTTHAFAQDYKYEQSEPIDVSLGGWNKVLLMRNGNTMFFHFEVRKGIIVKVFDKDHKEIANQKLIPKIMDINALDRSFLDAIADINGEAVLFITQEIDNRETTVRLNIDANIGKLLKEEKVIQSASFQRKTVTHFLKQKKTDEYYIAYAEKKAGFEEIIAGIKSYNNKHELVKDLPIDIDQKGYDKVSLEKVIMNENGDILICMELGKIIQFPDRWNKTYVMGYLPKGAEHIVYKKMELSSPWSYYHLSFTHNQFAHSLNILFSTTTLGVLQSGLNDDLASLTDHTLLVLNDDFSDAIFTPIKNKNINEQIKKQIDTGFVFDANVSNMYTNKYGLSTVLYTGDSEPAAAQGNVNVKTYRDNIAITQFDDKGQELWGTVLPKAKLRNYKRDYPNAFHKTSMDEISYNTDANFKNNIYVLYNDVNEYYHKTLSNSNDSIYNVDYTNAVCYRLARKKEITKSYLLGETQEGEYKQLCTGSTDFAEDTGEYAAVFLHRQGKEAKMKIAWVHFEP